MHNARIYTLYEHTATYTSLQRALLRGDSPIIMARREQVPERVRALSDKIVYIDPKQKNFFKKVKESCKYCDYIFLQSLAEDYTFAFHMLMNPNMLKKAVWVIAGGDLYSWAQPVKGGIKQKIGAKIRNVIALRYRKKIKYVICTSIDEYKYRKDIGTGTLFAMEANSPGYTFEKIESLKPKENEDKPLRIMIGHSSSEDLNHIDVIERLKNCGLPDNTEYLLPLNYGNREYGDKVEAAAKAAFGERAEVLRDRLPFDEYVKKLWGIDCAVFHTDRQIAFGNLLMLLYMKKKIFVKKDTVLCNYFNDRNVTVFDSTDLNAETLADTSIDLQAGRELALKVNNDENHAGEWENIFTALESRIGENKR